MGGVSLLLTYSACHRAALIEGQFTDHWSAREQADPWATVWPPMDQWQRQINHKLSLAPHSWNKVDSQICNLSYPSLAVRELVWLAKRAQGE